MRRAKFYSQCVVGDDHATAIKCHQAGNVERASYRAGAPNQNLLFAMSGTVLARDHTHRIGESAGTNRFTTIVGELGSLGIRVKSNWCAGPSGC
jgi:hypothetical protein